MRRALTLWPEWAWAIIHLDKRVENRGWALPIGEWIALHAGKSIGGRPGFAAELMGISALGDMAERDGWLPAFNGTIGGSWSALFFRPNGANVTAHDPRCEMEIANPIRVSAIVGAFRVTSVDRPGEGDLGGWRVPTEFGNRLEVRPLITPIPCKGAQGLWTLPADIRAEMARQLPEVPRG